MSYNALRELADSWGLVAMGVAYLVFVGWAFRPRAKPHNDHAATMIFDEESQNG